MILDSLLDFEKSPSISESSLNSSSIGSTFPRAGMFEIIGLIILANSIGCLFVGTYSGSESSCLGGLGKVVLNVVNPENNWLILLLLNGCYRMKAGCMSIISSE